MKGRINDQFEKLGGKPEKFLVGFGCLFQAETRDALQNDPAAVKNDGIVRIPVPCTARLTVSDLLAAFEVGAGSVTVVTCEGETCQHPTALDRIERRVKEAGGFLEQIGLGADRIQLVKTGGTAETEWPKIFTEAREKKGV